MELTFDDFRQTININNLGMLKIIYIRNYDREYLYKIDFPSGAREIRVIQAKNEIFISIPDYLMHIFSMPFAKISQFEFPDSFFENKCKLTPISLDEVNEYINGYFEGFFDYQYEFGYSTNLWKIHLDIINFKEGYLVDFGSTSRAIVLRTTSYYLYFVNYSID